ncbi:glycosyltransferase [Candidatus Uabimicrobium amorphum]|uniref:Dolichol-phosphate mannosyltransferase n=1 Tax=Uabimicrobium amorphum TaxID=2596890 RepID=A0A5S9IU23_UABAM|nr:glycosyltransferase [Candidatus Uabimicrobium amorphum]BBM87580.1 dolichol-phosphate mannosyltransferase [Candidatus Uabimicrobium amorphum]
MKVWIVLPAYNEELALPPLFEAIDSCLRQNNLEYEIIVVNDGSTDNTENITKDYASRQPILLVNQPQNCGLAKTIQLGLVKASSLANSDDVVVAMDADFTHPPQLIPQMLTHIEEGFDVIIASRYVAGSRISGVPFYRKVLSNTASFLFCVLFPTKNVRDFTCGYRAYRCSSLKELIDKYNGEFVSQQGFSCMVEILLHLRKQGAKMREVALDLRYDRKPSASKLKIFKTIFETLEVMWRNLKNR